MRCLEEHQDVAWLWNIVSHEKMNVFALSDLIIA